MALDLTPEDIMQLEYFIDKIIDQKIMEAMKDKSIIQSRVGIVTAVDTSTTPDTATVRLLGQVGTDSYMNFSGGTLAVDDVVYLQTTSGSLNSLIIIRKKP